MSTSTGMPSTSPSNSLTCAGRKRLVARGVDGLLIKESPKTRKRRLVLRGDDGILRPLPWKRALDRHLDLKSSEAASCAA